MAHENWNQKTTVTQKSQIKEWLLSGRSITPLEALSHFACMRLAAIIFELRDDGMDIVTEKVTNGRKSYAKYYLKKE